MLYLQLNSERQSVQVQSMQSMGALFLTSYLEELEPSSPVQQRDNNFVTLEEMKADP